MNHHFSLILIIMVCALAACSDKEESPYLLPKNAKALLTNDSSKTWKLARRYNNQTRMNMGDCFLSHRETYNLNMTMQDNSGEHHDCGETLQATWNFVRDADSNYYIKISSKQLPELMNIDKEYKLFKVLKLSADQLTVQFRHKQFSDKTTTITDIYVPENDPVDDREFHW